MTKRRAVTQENIMTIVGPILALLNLGLNERYWTNPAAVTATQETSVFTIVTPANSQAVMKMVFGITIAITYSPLKSQKIII